MKVDAFPENVLRLIKPQQVRAYAIAKGWTRVPGVNGKIALYNHPGAVWDQLIVPMDDSLDDYSRRLHEVVLNLAAFESRPELEVLNDLIAPDADILRFRVASPSTGRGSISLMEGIRLLEGAKKGLLASACSVLKPVARHPRMSWGEAQLLLNACRLGQTERGSFAFFISCPLRAVEHDQPLLPGLEPFARQAVVMLMRSLSRIVHAIEADAVASVFQNDDVGPVLSVNLCEALLEMQPPEDDSHLDVEISWAPTLTPQEPTPRIVRIKHEYFPLIEDISKGLEPAESAAASRFVGFVETLGGEPDGDGRMMGEATLSVLLEEQPRLARVDLSGDEWRIAHTALGNHAIVSLKGILRRGTRIHRITDIHDFFLLERDDPAESGRPTQSP